MLGTILLNEGHTLAFWIRPSDVIASPKTSDPCVTTSPCIDMLCQSVVVKACILTRVL